MSRTRSARFVVLGAIVACAGRAPEPAPDATAVSTPPPAADPSPTRPTPDAAATGPVDPASVPRLEPAETHARVRSGRALLVCAYGDDRCREVPLEGAIPWSALQARLPGLPRDREIILYCS